VSVVGAAALSVIWHDLECGRYVADLPLWRSLAAEHGGPVLDIGAGTGRVALALAREGHEVTALDQDPALLAELARRADGLPVSTVLADACSFDLGRHYRLCVMPMQTIQLLGGTGGRRRFLRCARAHLADGALLAVAISDTLELYEVSDGELAPLPDIEERDGIVYSSQPTAVRAERDGFVLERRREVIGADGRRTATQDLIHLDQLTPDQLEREAVAAGLTPADRQHVPATPEYVGSAVVMLRV
jgi:SAM-dependent methyltransferase